MCLIGTEYYIEFHSGSDGGDNCLVSRVAILLFGKTEHTEKHELAVCVRGDSKPHSDKVCIILLNCN